MSQSMIFRFLQCVVRILTMHKNECTPLPIPGEKLRQIGIILCASSTFARSALKKMFYHVKTLSEARTCGKDAYIIGKVDFAYLNTVRLIADQNEPNGLVTNIHHKNTSVIDLHDYILLQKDRNIEFLFENTIDNSDIYGILQLPSQPECIFTHEVGMMYGI